ncbi:Crp/Fnr family transcriptional regulator [Paenibacillus chartarius]|uniref:Crp/Fnr family transcriptional regulator n=1 Tax=Paenibacillus chartarius TaxID=747481 RepID=A0ABV6DL91_9BACL
MQLIQNVPLFQEYTREELEAIAPLFKERKYSRGSILFLEGDTGEEFFLIRSGSVKIYRIDDTKEIILALFREGDYFGEMSMMQRGLTRSATAETLENSVIYTMTRTDFFRFMEKSPRLCLKLLEVTMERLRKANEQIYDLTFLGVKSRVAKVMLRLADEHGVPSPHGTIIPIKLTHQQIANMVGAVRESVTKVLQELQDEDTIRIENKMILILKPNRLRDNFTH